MLVSNVVGTPATPRFAEVILKGSVPESDGRTTPVFNVFHYHADAAGSAVPESDFKDAFQSLILVPLTNALNPTYTLGSISVRYMDDPSRVPVEFARRDSVSES